MQSVTSLVPQRERPAPAYGADASEWVEPAIVALLLTDDVVF